MSQICQARRQACAIQTRCVCSSQGRTEVLVEEGRNTVSYVLDENLIDFGSALEEHDYDR